MLVHREASSRTFDLGQHVLEILDDQSVLVTDQEAGKETVQLDHDESYRLFIALQSVFEQEIPA